MNVEELLKENKELKEKLEKLLRQRESMKPFLCSDKNADGGKLRNFANAEESSITNKP